MILAPNSNWEIVDPSKIKVYMDCPREFFYRHILGWDSTLQIRNDLVFGSAWHKAMAYLDLHDYSAESIQVAYQEFLDEYRRTFDEPSDSMFPKKNPARALDALIAYTARWEERFSKFKTLYVEIAGTVTVHPELLPLHFRIDNVSEKISTGEKVVFERKTGTSFNQKWADQWQVSIQTGCYLHALFSLYDEPEVGGLIVDGAFFPNKKKGFSWDEFQEVPVDRSKEHMQVWLWNTVQWLSDLKEDIDILMNECKDSDPVMSCFKQNPESCTKYFGCPYLDFCMSWPNPLQHCDAPPLGFEVSWWDPREDDAQEKMNF